MPTNRNSFIAVATMIVVAGLALRLVGARGDLWLDEIWTLRLLDERALTPFHVFWPIQHDTSHPLYAFYAWFLPDRPAAWLYRLPAILFSTATIVVAGLIGARRRRAEAIFAMVLFAVSYPMVHYGSEARGYAPMMFCILVAYLLIDADISQNKSRHRKSVALALGAGFMFHMTTALAALALGLWYFWHQRNETGSLLQARRIARDYFRPSLIVFLSLLLLFAVAVMVHRYEFGATGDPSGFADRFVSSVGGLVRHLIGLPLLVPEQFAFFLVAGFSLGAVVWLGRNHDKRAPLYAFAILIIPGALFLLSVPAPAIGRYYLFGLVFLLPLMAQVLASAWNAGRIGRVTAGLIITGFILGSAQANSLFFEHGRGAYRKAIAFVSDQTESDVIELGSDHDFRQPLLLNHYGPVVTGKTIDYVERGELEARSPEWLILHGSPANSLATGSQEYATGWQVGDSRYYFTTRFRHWGFSGFDWLIYRRDDK